VREIVMIEISAAPEILRSEPDMPQRVEAAPYALQTVPLH
jgi:hypothetical protein